MSKKMKLRKTAIAACAALAIVGSSTAVYAADLGGIQRQVQIWVHGDQTTATMTIDSDNDMTTYSVSDSSGKTEQAGGGVIIDADGTERPASEEEVEAQLNAPDVETEDGHTCLYYKDQKLDLTGKFDADGLCYVTLKDGSGNLYVTVTKNGAYATSRTKYVQKNELPAEWFKD